MERNQIIGLVLITVFVFTWFTIFQSPEKTAGDPKDKQKIDSLAKAKGGSKPAQLSEAKAPDSTVTTLPDSAQKARELANKFGVFAPVSQGETKKILIKTDKLTLDVSTLGGALRPLYLNNFKTFKPCDTCAQQPLPLMASNLKDIDITSGTGKTRVFGHIEGQDANFFSMQLPVTGNVIDTKDLFFRPSINDSVVTVTGGEVKTLTMKAAIDEKRYIEHIYTFKGDAYNVGYQFKIVNLTDVISSGNYYMQAGLTVPKTEKSYENMLPEVNLSYLLKDGESVEHAELSTDNEIIQKTEALPIKWVGFKSQFFSTAIIANNKFQDISYSSNIADLNPDKLKRKYIRHFKTDMGVPYNRMSVDTASFTFYFGPNDYQILKTYDVSLDKMMNLGWGPLRYITLFMLYVFKALENFTHSYGLIIFILALFIKIILLPLSHRSALSTAKMQIINKLPDMLSLDEKYKDDPTTLQQKKMEVYNKFGVNPMGGCIPLLLQFPILIAMFTFFPKSIELRQQPFLWANDLSTYDSILDFGYVPLINSIYGDHVSLFTLLMTISTLLITYVQQQSQGPQTGPAAQMKYMGYIMPIMFLGILNNYSAGLSYYYLLQNVLTIAQTYLTKRFVINEEALKDKLHENMAERAKKGGGQKSWLQRKLEENQKAMEEQRKAQQNQRRKK